MADRFTITFEIEPLQKMWMNKIYKKFGMKLVEECGGPWGSELLDSALELVDTWRNSKNGHGPGRIKIEPLNRLNGRSHGPGRLMQNPYDVFASEQILFYEFVLKPEFKNRKIKDIEYTCGGKECGIHGHRAKSCGVMIRSYDDHNKIVECLRDLAAEKKIVTWVNEG